MPQTTARGPRKLRSTNPRTGEPFRDIPAATKAEVLDAVVAARKVAPEWGALDPRGRTNILKSVRHNVYTHLDEIVETIARECGKPRVEALATEVLQAVVS